jgi:two-component system, sensor histidine kinase and response regulator
LSFQLVFAFQPGHAALHNPVEKADFYRYTQLTMARIYRSKLKSKRPPKEPPALKRAYEELDRNARTLIRTDLQLHRANERFDQQISQLHALHRIGSIINSTFDLEEILSAISNSMAQDLDFEKSGIVFLDKASRKPLQSAYTGFSSSEYRHFLDHFEELLLPALQQEDVCLQTAQYAPAAWGKLLSHLSVSSLVLLPMRIKSRLIGVIVGGRTHVTLRLSEAERHFYLMYAAQASAAIENARLYEALGQANLTLEEKVAERTKNLVEANERLRELDQIKSNFISLVSHELRTPLTAIKGFIVTLYHYDKEISDEKRHVYLSVLNEETDRLTRLITELLDISRIESGRIDIQWQNVSLPALVQRVFDTLAMKAGAVQLEKHFSEGFPDIVADPDKLEQVFINLVGNSLKYSPVDGHISVRGRRYDDAVLVEVKDQGPGIAFSELEKVFDKFYRLDNETNRKNPGTGLGLPICRALINLHGGKIWVESEPGQGCRFLLSLPLNRDKALPAPAVSMRPASGATGS